MPRPPRHPVFWLGAFLLWFGVLWILSSRSGDLQHMPAIPFLDKVAHFGYFFGGGGLLSAFLFTWKKGTVRRPVFFLTVFVIIALVGAIDEYHQTFTPGRSGNDPFDWFADVTGALCGTLVFRRLRHLFA